MATDPPTPDALTEVSPHSHHVVIVEPDLSIPGHPEILVIGDLTLFAHQGGRPMPGVAPVAMQQGRYAAL